MHFVSSLMRFLQRIIHSNIKCSWQHLYYRGARTFWIHNTGPIGCLPVHSFYIRNPKPGFLDQFGCIRGHNEMAIEFNRQLKDRVTKLWAELPLAAITYVDVFTAKYKLISSTKVQGTQL